jgi:predicted aspartyl protease
MTTPDPLKLRIEGPIVDVFISEPGGSIPGERVRFMVDTGADVTIVSRRVVDGLGMVRTRMDRVRGATGAPARAPVYRAHLAIEVIGTTFDVDVLALVRESDDCDGLLGRDVLAHLRFVYDGPRGIFELRRE